jgi:hypothetical protein
MHETDKGRASQAGRSSMVVLGPLSMETRMEFLGMGDVNPPRDVPWWGPAQAYHRLSPALGTGPAACQACRLWTHPTRQTPALKLGKE